MITFWIKGGQAAAFKFLKKIKYFVLAGSLGGVESIVGYPVTMSHAVVPKEEREKMGINESTIRLSCGIEDVKDLIEDLKQALED